MASELVNELYLAAGKNTLYARQGRASANDQAAETRRLFQADTNLTDYFNQTFADGKWDHSWTIAPWLHHVARPAAQQPGRHQAHGTRCAGSRRDGRGRGRFEPHGPGDQGGRPAGFDAFNRQHHYLEVFNRGKAPFQFTATASRPWIVLSETKDTAETDQKLWVSVDWNKVPWGKARGEITVSGTGKKVRLKVNAFNPTQVTRSSLAGFVEGEGYVSIEAEHYTRNTGTGANRWIKIDDYGRTLSGLRAEAPVDAPGATPGKDSPCLEYRMYLFSTGKVDDCRHPGPRLEFHSGPWTSLCGIL